MSIAATAGVLPQLSRFSLETLSGGMENNNKHSDNM